MKPQIKIVLYGMAVAFLLAFLQALADPAALTNWRHAIPVALAGGAVAAVSWAKQSPFVKELLSEVERPPTPPSAATKGRADWLLVAAMTFLAGFVADVCFAHTRHWWAPLALGVLLIAAWRKERAL